VSGGVIQAGYAFNIPLRMIEAPTQSGPRPVEASFVTIDAPGVIVEVIKQAEDDTSLIVRMYEAANSSVQATLWFGFPIQSAAEANLMEIPLQALDVEQNAVKLSFSPFEIKTLKVVPIQG
ncbi:MAG: glycosyl hydrolase-related protein, partial [Omnitrophica WOR_2 bacterium]